MPVTQLSRLDDADNRQRYIRFLEDYLSGSKVQGH